MKAFIPAIFLFVFLHACKSGYIPLESAPKIRKAEYITYTAAMGKTRGVMFNITIAAERKFRVDSLVVNHRTIPFRILAVDSGQATIQGLWQVIQPDPVIDSSGKIYTPTNDRDPIIDDHLFTPAYVIGSVKGQKIELPISAFSSLNP